MSIKKEKQIFDKIMKDFAQKFGYQSEARSYSGGTGMGVPGIHNNSISTL